MDTDHLRRIMSASLPSGTRSAELFIESRIGLQILLRGSGSPVVRRRWETGAHLRRFSEGRHESFVLDAPTPESLEALVLHPEAIGTQWLSGGAGLGVAAPEARFADASAGTPAGPWTDPVLESALDLLSSWMDSTRQEAAGAFSLSDRGAELEAEVQEILVLPTDRDAARDTRRFVDATLWMEAVRKDRRVSVRETVSAADLDTLLARSGDRTGPPAVLHRRLRESSESVPAPRGEMPVVFTSPSGGFLLHEICGHLLEADHVVRGISPFAGARGHAVASELLTLADDGSIDGMRGSGLIDDEGIAARRTPLIMKGTLVGYLSDRLTAFVTDGISTGNGRRQSYRDAPMPRMTNLVIDSGDTPTEEIRKTVQRGLLVTRMGRGRVDPATGRFALAVEEGFLIERGRIGAPVSGAVLHGRAGDLLPLIDAVGDDCRADTGAPRCVKEDQAIPFGILQPTLRVSSMTVSGADR